MERVKPLVNFTLSSNKDKLNDPLEKTIDIHTKNVPNPCLYHPFYKRNLSQSGLPSIEILPAQVFEKLAKDRA